MSFKTPLAAAVFALCAGTVHAQNNAPIIIARVIRST